MGRSGNAQIAVDMYETLWRQFRWGKDQAWKGIARLLLTCEIWDRGWRPFHDVIVYQERNAFKKDSRGIPNKALIDAENLSQYLADELGVQRSSLCQAVGQYWRNPLIAGCQPHNLLGHAFRSLIVHILEKFGASGISYEEEVDPRSLFRGIQLPTRSKKPKLDIVARKGDNIVAVISSRWRYRHDRVDLIDEAMAYSPYASRLNPNFRFYAVVGEFSPARLDKVLSVCPPVHRNPPLDAVVHFSPQLVTKGLGANGRLQHLKSLEWLIDQTRTW